MYEGNDGDRLDALGLAVIIVVLGIIAVALAGLAITTLWQAGIINLVVVAGIIAGFSALVYAVYRTILEKDLF